MYQHRLTGTKYEVGMVPYDVFVCGIICQSYDDFRRNVSKLSCERDAPEPKRLLLPHLLN
jgi:hypothetical protein